MSPSVTEEKFVKSKIQKSKKTRKSSESASKESKVQPEVTRTKFSPVNKKIELDLANHEEDDRVENHDVTLDMGLDDGSSSLYANIEANHCGNESVTIS